MRSRFLTLLVFGCGLISAMRADTVYNEATDGDLSNSGLSPTVITVGAGNNYLYGATGSGANGIDLDYLTFTVPQGLEFTSLIELAGTTVGGNVSFIGMEAGDQVTLSPDTTSAAGLLGWDHYAAVSADTDLFPTMSVPADGSSGFTAPLGPGSYSFWIQEASPGTYSYAFDFVLASTPEPTTWPVLLAGIGIGAAALRRRIRE